MAKRDKTTFICQQCGHSQGSWSGKCPDCGEWNTLQEQVSMRSNASSQGRSLTYTALSQLPPATTEERLKSLDEQFDNLLGGGFFRGSVVLLAGQPGIGKSTFLMQLARNVSKNASVLYVSGEESREQVASRATRLEAASSSVALASSTIADDIAQTIAEGSFDLVIVDSIQTLQCSHIPAASGTVSQITNATHMLTQVAKAHGTTLVVVGHVTKEGSIAGPKVLEHSVDVVLHFEGDRYGGFKVLRSIKNRYGSTNESAIYEMTAKGLNAIDNPSATLLEERQVTDGSVVMATMEGSRPLLVEIQALVNKTAYGYPKRTASGFDLTRLNLLVAMLERRTKLILNDKDIYINVVGGIGVNEPAADLAIAMAIASATKGMQLKRNAVVFGELGLSGEVRRVSHIDKRIAEAKKLGFEVAIGPRVKGTPAMPAYYHPVADIRSALNQFLEKDA
jgi:DNA repair protein RadA/Sms